MFVRLHDDLWQYVCRSRKITHLLCLDFRFFFDLLLRHSSIPQLPDPVAESPSQGYNFGAHKVR